MTSIFARLCFAAAITFGALGLSTPVMAQTHALTGPAGASGVSDWSDAEVAELRSILQDALVPMLNELNGAVQTADTDRPAACTMAKSAAVKFGDADRRLTALYAKVKAEGRDVSRFDQVMVKMQDLRERMPRIVDVVCNGGPSQTKDPQVQAIRDKVMGLLRRYSDDMTTATNARANGDTAQACTSLHDGLLVLDELEAYMREIGKTYGKTQADEAEMQKILAQIQQWRTQTRETAKDCPAV